MRAEVAFVLERVPRKGVIITAEFDSYFEGRTSAREAFDALGRFVNGESVSFPVELRNDGFTGMGR